MTLPEELKKIIIEGKKNLKWHYSNEDYFTATEFVLTYLKEFKTITNSEDFNKETFKLWYFNKPMPNGDLILKDLQAKHLGLLTTKTGKMFMDNHCCKDVNLVACAASILQSDEKTWAIIASYFLEE